MQYLSASVGDNASNSRHDAALVQALLVLSQRPLLLDSKRSHYLTVIDGDFGTNSRKALRQFQSDQVFVGPDGRSCIQVPGDTAGQVKPGDVTWRKLVAGAPTGYQDLRVLKNSSTVFVAATTAQASASASASAAMRFLPSFGSRVAEFIRSMQSRYGLGIQVCSKGDLRSFQTQYELLSGGGNVTHAGPGESNHNFGQAVDLGFNGLRWLHRDGKVEDKETSWLHKLDPKQMVAGESRSFWDTLRREAIAVGFFRGPESDRPHLQAWSDAGIDMAARLADLLTRSGRMRWSGQNQRYKCDLSYGGKFFDVGRAAQVWSRQATVTVAMLNDARAQPGNVAPGALPGGIATPPSPATAADVAAMQATLRGEFEAAEANWQDWRAK